MASLTTQRARDQVEYGYLLVVESLPYGWTDIEALVGDASYLGAGRTIKGGLAVPKSVKVSSDLRGGMLEDQRTVFGLVDLDGTVGSMFAANQGQGALKTIIARILPGATVGATTAGPDSSSVDTWNRYIGPEYVDSAGARRTRYIVPSAAGIPAGWDHVTRAQDEGAPVVVGELPHVFAGLRVGLHRLIVNQETGAIDSWADQVASGSLIWQGRLVDRAEIRDLHTWEIECQGFDSWLRGDLNATNPDQYFPIQPLVDLEDSEKGIAVLFQSRVNNSSNPFLGITKYTGLAWDSAYDLTGANAVDLLAEISTAVADALDGTADNYTNANGNYATATGGSVIFGASSVRIKIPESESKEGIMAIAVHAKVAAALGWDFVAQAKQTDKELLTTLPDGGAYSDQKPTGGLESYRTPGAAALDFSGYVYAVFSTRIERDGVVDINNSGGFRPYNPAYSSGAITLLPAGRQVLALGLDLSFVEGQNAQPPGAYLPFTPQIGGADVDSMGWLHIRGEVLEGANAFDQDAERRGVNQVALVAWRDAAGTLTGDPGPQVYVVRWEDPRAFGFDEKRIDLPLTVGGTTGLEAAFIGRAGGYQLGASTYPDQAWRVIPRTILSSGTAGAWSGLTPPSAGDNSPAEATGIQYWAGDLEVSAMGLNVEGEAVELNSWRNAAALLPDGELGPLASCLYARVGPFQASDMLAAAHVSRGWCVGISKDAGGRPKYSCFAPWQPVTVADVEYTLTDADLADATRDGGGWVPGWKSRPFPPVDGFVFSTRDTPDDDSTTLEMSMRSLDRGRRSRTGQVAYNIEDPGLSNPRLFGSTPSERIWQWANDASAYWAKDAGNFLAGRTAELTAIYNHSQGQFLYPGTVVKVSNSFVQKLDGSGHGLMGALGRVTDTELILDGPYTGCTRATVLVQEQQAGAGEGGRMWMGGARVTSLTNTGGAAWDLVVEADNWNAGHGLSDSRAFEEPSGSSVGGTVGVLIYQSVDGTTWGSTIEADITSVVTGTHTISVSVTSGALVDGRVSMMFLDNYDAQAASNWPRTLGSVTTDGRGIEFGSGPTTGWKLD
jgi:hypothetical protein